MSKDAGAGCFLFWQSTGFLLLPCTLCRDMSLSRRPVAAKGLSWFLRKVKYPGVRQRCANGGGAVIFSREQSGHRSSSSCICGFLPPPSKQKLPLQGQGKLPVSSRGLPPAPYVHDTAACRKREGFYSFPSGSRGICLKVPSPSRPLLHRLRRSSRVALGATRCDSPEYFLQPVTACLGEDSCRVRGALPNLTAACRR